MKPVSLLFIFLLSFELFGQAGELHKFHDLQGVKIRSRVKRSDVDRAFPKEHKLLGKRQDKSGHWDMTYLYEGHLKVRTDIGAMTKVQEIRVFSEKGLEALGELAGISNREGLKAAWKSWDFQKVLGKTDKPPTKDWQSIIQPYGDGKKAVRFSASRNMKNGKPDRIVIYTQNTPKPKTQKPKKYKKAAPKLVKSMTKGLGAFFKIAAFNATSNPTLNAIDKAFPMTIKGLGKRKQEKRDFDTTYTYPGHLMVGFENKTRRMMFLDILSEKGLNYLASRPDGEKFKKLSKHWKDWDFKKSFGKPKHSQGQSMTFEHIDKENKLILSAKKKSGTSKKLSISWRYNLAYKTAKRKTKSSSWKKPKKSTSYIPKIGPQGSCRESLLWHFSRLNPPKRPGYVECKPGDDMAKVREVTVSLDKQSHESQFFFHSLPRLRKLLNGTNAKTKKTAEYETVNAFLVYAETADSHYWGDRLNTLGRKMQAIGKKYKSKYSSGLIQRGKSLVGPVSQHRIKAKDYFSNSCSKAVLACAAHSQLCKSIPQCKSSRHAEKIFADALIESKKVLKNKGSRSIVEGIKTRFFSLPSVTRRTVTGFVVEVHLNAFGARRAQDPKTKKWWSPRPGAETTNFDAESLSIMGSDLSRIDESSVRRQMSRVAKYYKQLGRSQRVKVQPTYSNSSNSYSNQPNTWQIMRKERNQFKKQQDQWKKDRERREYEENARRLRNYNQRNKYR